MSPVIELSETTFRRLQQLAEPFVDTPETVINRALDKLGMDKPSLPVSATSAHTRTAISSGARNLDPENPDNLAHTKIVHARFGKRVADKWNELLVQAHAEAMERLGSFLEVKRASQSPIVEGRRKDSGFHFQQNLGISIQYVDSNKAWQQTFLLAKRLGVPVEVQFSWREKEGAKYPGEFGLLHWAPKA